MSGYIQVIPGATAHPQEYSLQQGLSSAFNSIANGLKANWDYKWQQQRNANLLNQALHAYATGNLDGVSPDALPYLKGISDFHNAEYNALQQQVSKTAQIINLAKALHISPQAAAIIYEQRKRRENLNDALELYKKERAVDYGNKSKLLTAQENYKVKNMAIQQGYKQKNMKTQENYRQKNLAATSKTAANSTRPLSKKMSIDLTNLGKLIKKYNKTNILSLGSTPADFMNKSQYIDSIIEGMPEGNLKDLAKRFWEDYKMNANKYLNAEGIPEKQQQISNKPLTPKQKAKLDQILGY